MEGIIVKKLCKSYRGRKGNDFLVLKEVEFKWNPCEFISLVGESGCGKSTLARIMIGLEKPEQGRIEMGGENICTWNYTQWKKRRNKIQAVFQDTTGTLNPVRSVFHNLESVMVNLTDLSVKERRNRIEELMELTNMDRHLLKTPVRRLSGGEQRRLSLIRAMSIRPNYLILDEVTSGLDFISANAVMKVLERYREEYGCSFLFITHDKNQAYRLSNRILMMQNGRLVREGSKSFY